MSSERARARQKKRAAWIMLGIMFGGIFTSGIIYFGGQGGGGGNAQPSPPPDPPPLLQRNLSSFDDALRLAPAAALRVTYTSDRGVFGTDLGAFVTQRHNAWTQIYGSAVSAEVRVLLPPSGLPLWLHAVPGPGLRAPPAFTYRNATLIEFFPGQQPWLGIVTNTQPFIAGVRPPGRPRPPYLFGLDEVLDGFEGRADRTARDLFGDLARRLPPEVRFAGAAATSAQGWDNRSVFGVVPEGKERYLVEAYLAGPSPDSTSLQALQTNATAQGAEFRWNVEPGGGGETGDLARIEARGNWSQVRGVLSAGGFLVPGE